MCDRFSFGGENSLRSPKCISRVVEAMSGVEWDIKDWLNSVSSIDKFEDLFSSRNSLIEDTWLPGFSFGNRLTLSMIWNWFY